MNDFEEPSIPPHWRRPLTAAWISLAVHAALLVLVQVAPPATLSIGEPVIEARLLPAVTPARATEAAPDAPAETPPVMPEEPAPPPRLTPTEVVTEATVPARPPERTEPTVEPRLSAEPVPDPPAEAPPAPPAVNQPQPASPSEVVEATEATEAPAQTASPSPAPAAAITSAVDLTYYNVRELDVQPRALREIVPEYPSDADRQRLSGKVRLQLKLEADGRISDVEVVSATPPGVFDASTVQAFREARFAPAQKGGRPVRARVVIEVLYDWEGRMRRQ